MSQHLKNVELTRKVIYRAIRPMTVLDFSADPELQQKMDIGRAALEDIAELIVQRTDPWYG